MPEANEPEPIRHRPVAGSPATEGPMHDRSEFAFSHPPAFSEPAPLAVSDIDLIGVETPPGHNDNTPPQASGKPPGTEKTPHEGLQAPVVPNAPPGVEDVAAADPPATAADVSARRRLCPGMRFGENILRECIGEGGMGEVWTAESIWLGTDLVVKVVKEDFRHSLQATELFSREMQRQAKLRHPNIVRILFAGLDLPTDLRYIEMDHAGTDLSAWQKEQAKGTAYFSSAYFREVVRMMLQAVEAVQYTHSEGFVHRDIKPSNLFRGADGTVRLADFGLATPIAGSVRGRPSPVGTRRYMPPEQADGHADACSDVYALGATLYELLTGSPPLTENPSLDDVRTLPRGKPPHTLDPRVPRMLSDICMKCLELDPAHRYQTPKELGAALRTVFAPSAWRSRLRHPAVAMGLAFILLLVGCRWAYSLGNRWYLARSGLQQAEKSLEKAEQSTVDGKRIEAKKEFEQLETEFRKLEDDFRAIPLLAAADLASVEYQSAWVRACLARLDDEDRVPGAGARLENTLDQLEAIRPRLGKQPAFRARLAQVYQFVAEHESDQKRYDKAIACCKKGQELRQELVHDQSDDLAHLRDAATSSGYLGDFHLLETVQDFKKADDEYKDAFKKRKELLEKYRQLPAGEQTNQKIAVAVCLHGRDFGNRANCEEWQGKFARSLCEHRQRLGHFQGEEDALKALPGKYALEYGDAFLNVAEWELDLHSELPTDVEGLLDEAQKRFRESPEQSDIEWHNNLSRLHLARARWHLSRDAEDAAKLATNSLDDARRSLEEIEKANRTRCTEDYLLGLLHALRARLTDGAERDRAEIRSVDALKRAVNRGFDQTPLFVRQQRWWKVLADSKSPDIRQEYQKAADKLHQLRGWYGRCAPNVALSFPCPREEKR